VATALKGEPNLEVEVVTGRYGEFTVLADGEEIVNGGALGFLGVLPSVGKVKKALDKRLHGNG
jgi:hypothetical protein